MFAATDIPRGDTLLVWGGYAFTAQEVAAGKTIPRSAVPIGEELYLATKVTDKRDKAIYTNHSCAPNIWMVDEVTFASRRDIRKGEEITPDYCMWQNEPGWRSPWTCNCQSQDCRKKITGADWQLSEIQAAYANHFSPFINERIRSIRVNN